VFLEGCLISCIADSALALLDENACRAWWLRRLHPAGPCCPVCGVSITGSSVETWAADGLIRCPNCGKWFDNKTGTTLCGVHADWRQLTLLVSLNSAHVKLPIIARCCQISAGTVQRILRDRLFGGCR
jgi:hypothetical protein